VYLFGLVKDLFALFLKILNKNIDLSLISLIDNVKGKMGLKGISV